MVAHAVEGRAPVGRRRGRGGRLRDPLHVRRAHRAGGPGGQPAAARHPLRGRDGRAARSCPSSSTTTPTARCSPRRGPAPGRAAARSRCSRSAPGSAAAWSSHGEVYRGFAGGGAEMGHMVVDMDGPPVPGQLPEPGLPGVASPPGPRSCARRRCAVARQPGHAARARDGGRPRADRADGHRAGPRRAIRWRAAAIEVVGRALGRRASRTSSNIFCPQVDRHRRRRERRGRAAARARARGDAPPRAARRAATTCASRRRRSAPRRAWSARRCWPASGRRTSLRGRTAAAGAS